MMAKIIGVALIALLFTSGCKKQKVGCTIVDITNSAPGCGGWGIVTGGVKYPSGNIPDQFKQDGMTVCADFTLYADPRMCACCGGTWAEIKSMQYQK